MLYICTIINQGKLRRTKKSSSSIQIEEGGDWCCRKMGLNGRNMAKSSSKILENSGIDTLNFLCMLYVLHLSLYIRARVIYIYRSVQFCVYILIIIHQGVLPGKLYVEGKIWTRTIFATSLLLLLLVNLGCIWLAF
jgi:hypothetical protein